MSEAVAVTPAATEVAETAAPEPTPAVDSPWSDPKAAEAEIAKLRRENAAARTNAKEGAAAEARATLAHDVARALGLTKDNEAPNPDELAKQVGTFKADAQQARVELAVYRTAAESGGDPAALLDSASFLAKVAALDPSDSAGISTAVREAVEANPRLATAGAVAKAPEPNPAQGAGGGGSSQVTAADLERMTAAEVVEARKAGRLNHLMGA